MASLNVRSPSEKVGGLVYFGRMLDKIREHAAGRLPPDYVPNLGAGFDKRCADFLGVAYDDLAALVKSGASDEAALQWCHENGAARTADELHIWNEFMRKCGWNDDITPTLLRRKKESGFTERDEIQTMFQYIDADEGRPVSG